MVHDEVRRVLDSDALAHVATVDTDGRPHVTIAWVGLEDGEVVFATLSDQRKLRNVRRDPRVTISIETPRTNEIGLREYLVIYGSGRVTKGGAPQLLQELARTYLGPDVEFPPMPDSPDGYVTRVSIDRVAGIGPWT